MQPIKFRTYIKYLPIYGCIATGIIYLGIGTVAILSFLKLKEGGADESSLLAYLNEYVLGKIFVWLILVGTVGYIVWRIYEALTDPYEYGNNTSGKAKRIGIALSSVADILIAYSAVQILLGTSNVQVTGQPDEERELVSNMLLHSWGSVAVVTIGSVIGITALVQLFYGLTRGYKERLNVSRFGNVSQSIIHVLAYVGYSARAAILGIIAFFFIKSGIIRDADHVVNTDKAFDFVGDHVGHVFFILLAAGTICYGLFMFSLGGTYDSDKD
jgi:hypothetical protein